MITDLNKKTISTDITTFTETSPQKEAHSVTMEKILFAARENNSSGFSEARLRILSEKRFVRAMDFAANCPEWWHVNRLHFYNPEMSHAKIANLLGIHRCTVTRWINRVQIPEDDYEGIPESGPTEE